MEFNNWYNNKLKEGKHSKVNSKNSKIFYDKIAPGHSSIFEKNVHDDIMYMQVPSGTGKEDEMSKQTDVSAIVVLLQAMFAILLVSGKTLHEQSLQIARLSQLSKPSLLSHLHPEVSLSHSSQCSCQTQSEVRSMLTTALKGKVSSVVNVTITGVTWFRQMWKGLTADIATSLYQVGCGMFDILVPETEFDYINK